MYVLHHMTSVLARGADDASGARAPGQGLPGDEPGNLSASIHLSIYLFIYLSIYLSMCIHLYMYLCLSIDVTSRVSRATNLAL